MKPLFSDTQALRYQTDDGTTRVEVSMAGFKVNALATSQGVEHVPNRRKTRLTRNQEQTP